MRCGHKGDCCMRLPCSDRVRMGFIAKPPQAAPLGRTMRCICSVVVALCVSLALQVSSVPAQIVSFPRELAVIRINLLDLLANEPSLPLPIRQRHEALQAYYQTYGGELLWLGRSRASAFISRLKNAEADGLERTQRARFQSRLHSPIQAPRTSVWRRH